MSEFEETQDIARELKAWEKVMEHKSYSGQIKKASLAEYPSETRKRKLMLNAIKLVRSFCVNKQED